VPLWRPLVISAAVGGIGIAIPVLMNDGVDDQPVQLRDAARYAVFCAEMLIDNLVERAYSPRLRVWSISAAPESFVIVWQHTFFGVPIGRIAADVRGSTALNCRRV